MCEVFSSGTINSKKTYNKYRLKCIKGDGGLHISCNIQQAVLDRLKKIQTIIFEQLNRETTYPEFLVQKGKNNVYNIKIWILLVQTFCEK